jgi:CTP:phosphocholine cytidylyltransferase-like protein
MERDKLFKEELTEEEIDKINLELSKLEDEEIYNIEEINSILYGEDRWELDEEMLWM